MIVPIILAGGSGTRLWPLSRETYPKQFLPLLDGQSLFQHTLKRLLPLPNHGLPIVVGNEQHRFIMAEQIRQVIESPCSVILEPSFKGTAPAVALGAIQALKQYDHDVMLLVLPADHVIHDADLFAQTVQEGVKIAELGKLVTFGVTPTHAETGYGYIQKGQAIDHTQGFNILRFVEKPHAVKAQRYFESQEYFWNSGMFLFSAAAFLQELILHVPQMYHCAKAALSHGNYSEDFIRPNAQAFDQSPADSLDYAIMERTHNSAVISLPCDWSDVGAWDALAELIEAQHSKDTHGNVCIGDVFVKETQNCLIQSEKKLVTAVGVKDLVIVETKDAVLVMDKNHAQSIKSLVSELRENARKEITFHACVNRPWGAFESIDAGERFQVKRITVAVDAKLSLQRHHHRSEHWVVVKGTARVTRGEEVFLLSENQSTYIPIGVNHRLENVGKIPLEIIEVQSGAYLGEDDIVRLDDQYGRSQPIPVEIVIEESIEKTEKIEM